VLERRNKLVRLYFRIIPFQTSLKFASKARNAADRCSRLIGSSFKMLESLACDKQSSLFGLFVTQAGAYVSEAPQG
jgi:hypothetical protein